MATARTAAAERDGPCRSPSQAAASIESREQLADYLASGCKPEAEWRIGTEHEKFGYRQDDLLPLPYEGDCSIHAMLSGLSERYGWAPVEEAGKLIGLTKDGANVSLEPGGQLELSGAPLETIHGTCDEVNEHLREVKALADDMGAGFIGLGAAPIWREDQMPVMPKGRYALMTRYMREVGTHGTQMMYRTCTVQVNLDFASEADMVKKFRVSLALQPVATALFANSPFFDGKAERLAVVAGADLAGHRPGAHRHAALRLRGGHGLRALRRLRARRADVLRLPRRQLPRRSRPVVPRLPRRPPAGAARREADASPTGPTT